MQLSRFALASAACLAAAALSACNTTTTTKLLDNLSTDCERHYDGTVQAGLTGGGFSGTVKIDCSPGAAPPVK